MQHKNSHINSAIKTIETEIEGLKSLIDFFDEKYKYEYQDKEELINDGFKDIENPTDICSKQNLEIQTNVNNISIQDDGGDNDYNPFA